MRDSLKKTCNLLIRSIIMSDLSESLKVAHLSWATLVICSFVMSDISDLLICHERPEQFAHSHSFVLSNLSKSLTVAHLSWANWANCSFDFSEIEQMSDEQMSEFPALQTRGWNPRETLYSNPPMWLEENAWVIWLQYTVSVNSQPSHWWHLRFKWARNH